MSKDTSIIISLIMAFVSIMLALIAEDQSNAVMGIGATLSALYWLSSAVMDTFYNGQ